MPKTEHFGFPLMADVPPEGTTGKDLRDAILGEGKDSLASMVDDALHGVESKIPDADSFETTDNKLEYYNGIDGGWHDVSPEKYPSSQAVNDFVRDYVTNYMELHDLHLPTNRFFLMAMGQIIQLYPMVDVERFDWDGVVDGHFGLLGQFYKISDSTSMEGSFKVGLSMAGSEEGELRSDILVEPTIADLKEALGIVIYTADILPDQPILAVADRAGMLPAAVIEALMGVNPGADIPYEAGTYVLHDGSMFVSSVKRCLPIKDYIDKRLGELR